MGLYNMNISRAKRQAAARKAARTRARNQAKRKAAARKAVRTRKTKRRAAAKRHIIKKSPL